MNNNIENIEAARPSLPTELPGYAAASLGSSQPGKTRTPGWTFRVLARILARSTPSRTRSFSIAEMVAWGIPVSFDSWFWLNSCSSRIIRTDSPTDTVIRFFAGRYSLISAWTKSRCFASQPGCWCSLIKLLPFIMAGASSKSIFGSVFSKIRPTSPLSFSFRFRGYLLCCFTSLLLL